MATGAPPLPLLMSALSVIDGRAEASPLLKLSDSWAWLSAACAASGTASIAITPRPVARRRRRWRVCITQYLLHLGSRVNLPSQEYHRAGGAQGPVTRLFTDA